MRERSAGGMRSPQAGAAAGAPAVGQGGDWGGTRLGDHTLLKPWFLLTNRTAAFPSLVPDGDPTRVLFPGV